MHAEQSQWNTMKGSDFCCPRSGVECTAGTVDSDDDVTMIGGATHFAVPFSVIGLRANSCRHGQGGGGAVRPHGLRIYYRRCGCALAGKERPELTASTHQRGREDAGSVLLDA